MKQSMCVIDTVEQSLSSIGQYSSLADHPNTKSFGPNTTLAYASDQYVNYDFITVLNLAQKLDIPFLPIT